MSKHAILVIVAIVIVALLVAGYFYFMRGKTSEEVKIMNEQKNLEKLSEAVKQTSQTPVIEVPSGNPLEKLAPKKNPLEVTNPFKDGYKNPFD